MTMNASLNSGGLALAEVAARKSLMPQLLELVSQTRFKLTSGGTT